MNIVSTLRGLNPVLISISVGVVGSYAPSVINDLFSDGSILDCANLLLFLGSFALIVISLQNRLKLDDQMHKELSRKPKPTSRYNALKEAVKRTPNESWRSNWCFWVGVSLFIIMTIIQGTSFQNRFLDEIQKQEQISILAQEIIQIGTQIDDNNMNIKQLIKTDLNHQKTTLPILQEISKNMSKFQSTLDALIDQNSNQPLPQEKSN